MLYSFSFDFFWIGLCLLATWVLIASAHVCANRFEGETREDCTEDYKLGMRLLGIAVVFFIGAAYLIFSEKVQTNLWWNIRISGFLLSIVLHLYVALDRVIERDS